MRRTLAIALAAACVVGAATSVFARNAGHNGHGGRVHDRTILLAPEPPRAHYGSRIPAPLGPPAQAPTINGPISQPAFRGLTGIGQ
jgi:hypothetical protein